MTSFLNSILDQIWETIKRIGVGPLVVISLMLCTFLIHNVDMRDRLDAQATQIEQYEQTVEGYEGQISEYRKALDSEIDKNAQLSETITELQDALTALQSDLEALREEHKDCRPPVVYSSENVLTPSYVTAEELSKGLLYELKPYASSFVKMEEEYGINAVFLASIAALESGWCRTEIALNNNNLFGYKNPSGEGFRKFSSKTESIYVIAKHLKNNYLTEGGTYYNGLSVNDVNVRYCEQMCWASKIDKIANGIVNRIYGV